MCVSNAIELRWSRPRGHHIVARRDIPAAKPLMSIPTRLTLAGSAETPEPVSLQLARKLLIGLWDETTEWQHEYAKLMFDGCPFDRKEEQMELAKVTEYFEHRNAGAPHASALQPSFQGCAVNNAPYLDTQHMLTPSGQRTLFDFQKDFHEWRIHLNKSAQVFGHWAASVALSRAISLRYDQSEVPRLVPLLDFCNHSFVPNADVTLTHYPMMKESDAEDYIKQAVRGAAVLSEPHIHLVASTDVAQGEEITIRYGSLPPEFETSLRKHGGLPADSDLSPEAYDAWMLQWGFVPDLDAVPTLLAEGASSSDAKDEDGK